MGELFSQGAIASSVSTGGALLSGITRQIRPQDVVWVEYSGRKARFKIVWVRNSESQQLTQAAVQLFSGQDCPWKDEITVS